MTKISSTSLISHLFTLYHLFWMKIPRLQAYELFRPVFASTRSFFGTYRGLVSFLLSFYAFYNKNADPEPGCDDWNRAPRPSAGSL